MALDIIIHSTATIVIIAGILNGTRSPDRPARFLSKRAIRIIVIASASIAFFASMYSSAKDKYYSESLLAELDSLKRRMELLDVTLLRISREDESKRSVPSPQKPVPAPKRSGNVAGYVNDIGGLAVPFVEITDIESNTQTTSHEDGAFILVGVYEGAIFRFKKEGYDSFDHTITLSDFKKVVSLTIKEE